MREAFRGYKATTDWSFFAVATAGEREEGA
jgi:hypothetical protein